MSQEVLEKQEKGGETQPHPNYRVLVINDNRNSFSHLEECLVKHIPGMSSHKAHQIALQAHNQGVAMAWVGPREMAEMYYELLKNEGLSMALEPDV